MDPDTILRERRSIRAFRQFDAPMAMAMGHPDGECRANHHFSHRRLAAEVARTLGFEAE